MNNTVVYSDGELELSVSVEGHTIWLNAEDIASIFSVKRPAVVKHIGNIYKDEELELNATCSILEQVAKDGKIRQMNFYNLDMIISIGYRVNSKKATKFRQWATSVLKNYVQDGYAINSEKITHERFVSLENAFHSLDSRIGNVESLIKKSTTEIKQGIFCNEQIFEAYSFVASLIKSAHSSITLIDNYVDESVLTLFSKNQNIQIIIYTQNISKELELDIKKYNKQYHNLQVKITKNFHDRFMILDNKEVYHLGASLKDLGNKVFAFSKFEIDAFEILGKL
jgi:prophage antirepressor-like protein